ncbi:MAG TPA: hypothetical protein VMB50_19760 [Myxococcales bacterium]|nr:hypothetical protein [Myxococcales bacterium]
MTVWGTWAGCFALAGLGTCPAAPEDLTGTGAAGTPCTDETQCEPACCSCPNGYPATGPLSSWWTSEARSF